MSRFVKTLAAGDELYIASDKIVALQRRYQNGATLWLATMDNAMTFLLSEGVVDFLLDECKPDHDEVQSPTEIAALKKEAAAPDVVR